MCWLSTTTPTFGWVCRRSAARRMPSSLRVGGIRMSVSTTSGSSSSTDARRESRSSFEATSSTSSIRSSAREMPSRTRKLSSPTTTRIVIGARRCPVRSASVPSKYPCGRKFRPISVRVDAPAATGAERTVGSRAAPVPAPPRTGCIHPIHSVNPRSNTAPGARHDRSPVLALTAGVAMNETRTPERRAGARAVLVEPAADALPFDVVESKLRPPAAPAGAVSRTALVNRLRADLGARAISVVAPGGYGKTTLLAQWAARDERRFAWITLDRRDNDPIVLLRHLAAADRRTGAHRWPGAQRARRSKAVLLEHGRAAPHVRARRRGEVRARRRRHSRALRAGLDRDRVAARRARLRELGNRHLGPNRVPDRHTTADARRPAGARDTRSRAHAPGGRVAPALGGCGALPRGAARICSTGPRAGRGPSSWRRSRRGGRPTRGRRPTSSKSRSPATIGS